MKHLTNLVIKYKQTKNKEILDQIYQELKPIIQQKARYIYYAKWYPLNLYHPCKYCRNCDKLIDVPKEEHNIICRDCDICKCVKGFFNLYKSNLCEYEDVENDIWVEVLRVIDNFDITKDFNTYLFSCLWEFIPSFVTKDFINTLLNNSLTQQTEENENEIDITNEIKVEPSVNIDEFFKVCKSKLEKKILTIILKHKKVNKTEIATELGFSSSYISLILKKMRKKLKKLL